MRRWATRIGFFLIALYLVHRVDLPTRAAETGTLTGVVDRPAAVAAVSAIDRDSGKSYPGTFDAKAGRFTVAGLPLGARYDCLIDHGQARLEGADLHVPRSDYEEEQPLKAEDIKTLDELVRSLSPFEDRIEVLAIRGNIQNAAVLVNKLRTRPFLNAQPGEVVWRAELWRFERPEETWVKVQDDLFQVLYRQRLTHKDYDRKSITFDPALGGLRPTAAAPAVDLGRIDLPPDDRPGITFRGPRTDIDAKP